MCPSTRAPIPDLGEYSSPHRAGSEQRSPRFPNTFATLIEVWQIFENRERKIIKQCFFFKDFVFKVDQNLNTEIT